MHGDEQHRISACKCAAWDDGKENVTIKEMQEKSGMNIKQFSEYFKLNYRTVQHWEYGTRKCPEYLIELIEYKLKNEKLI